MTISKLLAGGLMTFLAFASSEALAQGDAAKGERLFARCRACHSLEPGENKVGPTLAGVVGREAGTVEGFNYSDAMKNAGVTWTPEELDAFLADPRKHIPGTKMVFAGLKKEEDRQDIIAYLQQAASQ